MIFNKRRICGHELTQKKNGSQKMNFHRKREARTWALIKERKLKQDELPHEKKCSDRTWSHTKEENSDNMSLNKPRRALTKQTFTKDERLGQHELLKKGNLLFENKFLTFMTTIETYVNLIVKHWGITWTSVFSKIINLRFSECIA